MFTLILWFSEAEGDSGRGGLQLSSTARLRPCGSGEESYLYCSLLLLLLLLLCLLSLSFSSLNQRRSPPLSLPVSNCSTFHIMCDGRNTAFLFSEYIECFHCIASKFFFKPFVTIPVATIISGIIIHFIFHIRCISTHKLLYLTL